MAAVLKTLLLLLAGIALAGCINSPSEEDGRAWRGVGTGYSSPGSVSDREWR